jgi:S1-C subfamily serine protease
MQMAASQYPPVTSNALTRVFFVKTNNVFGTGFTLERNSRQFLVTARHVIPSARDSVAIHQHGTWQSMGGEVFYPKNPAVDIAVLRLDKHISLTLELEPSMDGMVLGQDLYFLGFPLGMYMEPMWNGCPLPLIKHGVLSAIDSSDKSRVLIYLDAFGNLGFSGSPVIFRDLKSGETKVAGIVTAFRTEESKVQVGGAVTNWTVPANSGILIAASVLHAIEAIEAANTI